MHFFGHVGLLTTECEKCHSCRGSAKMFFHNRWQCYTVDRSENFPLWKCGPWNRKKRLFARFIFALIFSANFSGHYRLPTTPTTRCTVSSGYSQEPGQLTISSSCSFLDCGGKDGKDWFWGRHNRGGRGTDSVHMYVWYVLLFVIVSVGQLPVPWLLAKTPAMLPRYDGRGFPSQFCWTRLGNDTQFRSLGAVWGNILGGGCRVETVREGSLRPLEGGEAANLLIILTIPGVTKKIMPGLRQYPGIGWIETPT